MVTREQVDELIEKTDIVDLVSQYVSLEKAGAGFKGLCPFHNEKTPSFMVSPSKKIAKCMGCGGGGNPISFLMQIKNISYPEALTELANKAGMKLEGLTNVKKENDYSSYYKIMEIAKKFYVHNLFNTKSGLEALKYLNNRGLDEKTIKEFGIGLALNTNDSLYKVLKMENVNELDMTKLGLVKNGNEGFYDLFRSRIMFPVTDEFGHTIAFSGRIYKNEADQAKYVNSPETIIYKKSNTLFHLSDAISEIRKSHRIVLHEGQMDVIASVRSNIKEAVCSMGTALTIEQVKLISKYANEVIIAYDGDNAGQHAILKASNLLSKTNIKVHVVILKNAKDSDEFVAKYGSDKWEEYFNKNQIEPHEFIIDFACRNKNFDKIEDIDDAKRLVFDYLRNENSQIIIDKVLDKLSKIMLVSKASLTIDFNNYYNVYREKNNYENNNQPSIISAENTKNKEILSAGARAELRLINYAKISKEKANLIENNKLFNNDFINYLEPIHKDLWTTLVDDYYLHTSEFNEQQFLSCLNRELHNCYRMDIETLKNNLDSMKYDDYDMESCIASLAIYKLKKDIDLIDSNFLNLGPKEKIEASNKKIKLLKQIMDIKLPNNKNLQRK